MLDTPRLGKQRAECYQIARALTFRGYGWKSHPAVAMWRGFVPALVAYGLAVCAEWERRGHADAVRPALLEFTGRPRGQERLRRDGGLPPWLGERRFHASHRAALVRKHPEYYARLFPDVAPDAAR